MQEIEIVGSRKSREFDIFRPLWLGRSFMAWTNFLFAEVFVILSIISLGTFISILFGFLAGMNFAFWYEDSFIQRYRILTGQSVSLMKKMMERIQEQ